MSKKQSVTLQATLAKFHSDLWWFHIKIPVNIAAPFLDKDRRILCALNGTKPFACALMPDGEGNYFININKERRKKLRLEVGDPVEATLQKDESKYGMPMPEVMGELLAQDPDADKYFHALTPGKQRSLLYIVAKPKTESTRLKKAIVITEFLKTNQGKLDFKELNVAFKEYG